MTRPGKASAGKPAPVKQAGSAVGLSVFLLVSLGLCGLVILQRDIGLGTPVVEDPGTETQRYDPRLHQVDYRVGPLPLPEDPAHASQNGTRSVNSSG